ncbi:MAG: hypothetical protein ACTHU0_17950 [Kofleriaceae bacterium]
MSPRFVCVVLPPVFASLVAGCASSSREAPVPGQRAQESRLPGAPAGQFTGTLGGHRFAITVEGGEVTEAGPTLWTWKLGVGAVSLQELGPAGPESHFLVERSPRTVVRSDGGFLIVTEVVKVVGDRVFSCAHEQRVADPDAPDARPVVDRGIAVCTSLRVEP